MSITYRDYPNLGWDIVKNIYFSDKFSFCMIKATEFLHCSDKDQLIQNFYNDAFWFMQMHCRK